jgi:guanidinopropionase
MSFVAELQRLREKYSEHAGEGKIFDEHFRKVAAHTFSAGGTRSLPCSGVPTLLGTQTLDLSEGTVASERALAELDVGLFGVPVDIGVTNRPGARFGPRALRGIERIGPYNHVLRCCPAQDLRLADLGDVPFASRYLLEKCHADIEGFAGRLVRAGVVPLAVGGDHSISHPLLRAVGANRPVGLIHIDAHCDTAGEFDMNRFHHGAPFRNAVLDGVLDPQRTIQIGIRGSAEYLWEFSYDAGMTVIHAEEVDRIGIDQVAAMARDLIGDDPVYVSFDIDCLDPSFAPGTGTPEVGGLSTREVLALLRALKGLDIVGADVVEVAPQYDATTNTAHAGAQVLFEIASLLVFSPSLTQRRAAIPEPATHVA